METPGLDPQRQPGPTAAAQPEQHRRIWNARRRSRPDVRSPGQPRHLPRRACRAPVAREPRDAADHPGTGGPETATWTLQRVPSHGSRGGSPPGARWSGPAAPTPNRGPGEPTAPFLFLCIFSTPKINTPPPPPSFPPYFASSRCGPSARWRRIVLAFELPTATTRTSRKLDLLVRVGAAPRELARTILEHERDRQHDLALDTVAVELRPAPAIDEHSAASG